MKKSFIILLIFVASLFASDFNDEAHNRCIVKVKDNLNTLEVKNLANKVSTELNSSIKYLYSKSIKGFTINTPCFAFETAFGDSDFIESIEPDMIINAYKGKPSNTPGDTTTTTPSQKISYGTTRVGGPVDGTGKTAWIIDSGVDTDHPDLNVNTSKGFTLFNTIEDQHGHGTHVAGIIGAINNEIGTVGVASNTTIVPIRVLDRRGSGSVSGVIAGIEHVALNASAGDCVNLSLGGGISSTLDSAVINAASSSGAFFVLAAGNESDDANNHSPARANGINVFTISATDEYDNHAWFSNYGNPPIDYAAPGVNILSLSLKGTTTTLSGTSMAAPHACAVLMMTNGTPSTNGNSIGDFDNNPDLIIHLNN